MAMPSSGTISLSQLQGEFGGSNPISMSEYYRNGGRVPSNNTNVPTSGQISMSQFYGAVNEVRVTISSNSGSIKYASNYFGGNWGANVPKRLTINSGVTMGSSSTSQEAFQINSGMGGSLIFINNGSIQGASGGANSGTGGDALRVNQSSGVTINNNGSILAGGGGGGRGGNGGTGGGGVYYTTSVQNLGSAQSSCLDSGASCEVLCDRRYGNSAYCGTCRGYSCNDDDTDDYRDDQDSGGGGDWDND